MGAWRSATSRTVACVAVLATAAVVAVVEPLWRGDGAPERAFSPSQRLADAYMSLVCRPPNAGETLRWDGKPFTMAELGASVMGTPEGERVRALRRIYLDVLLRDPFEGDCAGLRAWVERPIPPADFGRRLAASSEGQRVAEVRGVLADVQGRDPAGWDSATVRRWAQTGFSPTEIRIRLAEQRPLVGVYYFAWYGRDSRGWGNGADIVTPDTPQPSLGWYESGQPGVMDAHIEQIERTGFDFVIVQVAADSPASWEKTHRFFGRIEGRRLKVVVMLDGIYTAPLSVVAAWIEKARTEFAAYPNYLMLRDTPLLLIYSGRLDFGVPNAVIRNVYWADAYGPGKNTFNSDGRLFPRDWPFWAPTPPLVNGVVPVVPGYSDGHLARDGAMEHPRNDGQMYHDQWQRALTLRPEFITVYSWNEHFERTAIEPTEAWGERYLDWTRCYIARAHAGRVGAC